mmetsp:Transcript_13830/g.20372  ORF Transcript_13830/g.20372 Transcript_13830/m.20372 type:complete len:197 (+) Transcript_13830:72-662(+)|eukprot:CAMPEP_0113945158 /NCGR_PEP_ID=MMETSP1339-20121228/39358_1 /TAXON_ID=94617 /ORGANISM="Fibrocapsa japonica" /LENGTH=196 /DNA_ID=CAMNT_0000950589 /DNA_START=46 /DNA_END=636 /DNA_ORIENTATION=- /assembly_acc=CAM_ASM_000762
MTGMERNQAYKHKLSIDTENLQPVEQVLNMSPRMFITAILQSCGHSIKVAESSDVCQIFKQCTGYNQELVSTLNSDDASVLKKLLDEGYDANASNKFGESILHKACRRGHKEAVNELLRHKAKVLTRDDMGRTPMHDACWLPEPDFALVELLSLQDKNLMWIMDNRGHLPLDYIPQYHWREWNEFFLANPTVFFGQ